MNSTPDDDHPGLVDEHFRPFVRALGNLVITFALAEAKLLEMVSEMLSGVELQAVALLKSQDAIVRSIGLTGFDLEELLAGVDTFWEDKAARNRLVHDEWFPNVYEGAVATRGLTRTKTPEEVFGTPNVLVPIAHGQLDRLGFFGRFFTKGRFRHRLSWEILKVYPFLFNHQRTPLHEGVYLSNVLADDSNKHQLE